MRRPFGWILALTVMAPTVYGQQPPANSPAPYVLKVKGEAAASPAATAQPVTGAQPVAAAQPVTTARMPAPAPRPAPAAAHTSSTAAKGLVITDRDPEVRRLMGRTIGNPSRTAAPAGKPGGLTGEDVIATARMAGGMGGVSGLPTVMVDSKGVVRNPRLIVEIPPGGLKNTSGASDPEMQRLEKQIKACDEELNALTSSGLKADTPEYNVSAAEILGRQKQLRDQYNALRRKRSQAAQPAGNSPRGMTIEFESSKPRPGKK